MGDDEQVSYSLLQSLGAFPGRCPGFIIVDLSGLGKGGKWAIKVDQGKSSHFFEPVPIWWTGKFEQQRNKANEEGRFAPQTMCRVNSIRPDPTKSNHFFVWMVVGLPQRYGHME